MFVCNELNIPKTSQSQSRNITSLAPTLCLFVRDSRRLSWVESSSCSAHLHCLWVYILNWWIFLDMQKFIGFLLLGFHPSSLLHFQIAGRWCFASKSVSIYFQTSSGVSIMRTAGSAAPQWKHWNSNDFKPLDDPLDALTMISESINSELATAEPWAFQSQKSPDNLSASNGNKLLTLSKSSSRHSFGHLSRKSRWFLGFDSNPPRFFGWKLNI